jgi:predicted amidohydrolase YtcJ
MLALHAAVTRSRPDGTPEGGWHPEERLTLESAIKAYTSAAAWASFDEHRKGLIKPGMLADMVVLDRDIFEEPPSALASTTVDVTIFDGKVVYKRDKHRDTE